MKRLKKLVRLRKLVSGNKLINRFSLDQWLLIGVVGYWLVSALVYGLASLVKHSHYQTLADLAVFNQGIWQYSRFKWPYISLHLKRPFLADHFHPILLILAPLYWLWPGEEVLLFVQPFIILSTLIPLFLISRRLTKSLVFSLVIVLATSFYLPLQYTIFYDFHVLVFLAPLLAWAYYFTLLERKGTTSLFLVLMLLVKEEAGFLVAGYGLYLLLFKKKWRWLGGLWLTGGILYSLLMMYLVIPSLGGSYLYFNFGASGQTPLAVIVNFVKQPGFFLKQFFNPAQKRQTLKMTLGPFAFLPLFSPLSLLLALEQFFSRFLDLRNTARWSLGYHYSAPMVAIMPLGAILTAANCRRLLPKRLGRPLLIGLSILLVVLTRLEQINRSAILLIKRPQFWARSRFMDSLDQAVDLIPDQAAVATQNNLAPHLSCRSRLYFLKDLDQADYILVDFHSGQSDYHFFGRQQRVWAEEQISRGISRGWYQVIFQENRVYLLKKNI